MILQTPADFTCNGSQQQLATDTSKAKWMTILADSSNGSAVRIGDVNTSGSRGFPLAAGASLTLPTISDPMEFYPLNKIYVFGANGTVLHVVYGVEGTN